METIKKYIPHLIIAVVFFVLGILYSSWYSNSDMETLKYKAEEAKKEVSDLKASRDELRVQMIPLKERDSILTEFTKRQELINKKVHTYHEENINRFYLMPADDQISFLASWLPHEGNN